MKILTRRDLQVIEYALCSLLEVHNKQIRKEAITIEDAWKQADAIADIAAALRIRMGGGNRWQAEAHRSSTQPE